MIIDGKKWHYLAVKKLSALLRGITSNYVGDFYYLNCFHSHRIEDKLKKHENVYKNNDYCYIEKPEEGNKVLKYNHEEKSMKHPFVIYTDLECLLKNMSTSYSSPEKSSTTKKYEHTPSGYSMFTHCLFDATKNKLDYYRGKNCMERFFKDLKEHAKKIINYKKRKWYY